MVQVSKIMWIHFILTLPTKHAFILGGKFANTIVSGMIQNK